MLIFTTRFLELNLENIFAIEARFVPRDPILLL